MFDDITDFNNLYAAYKAAARGKHDRAEVLRHDLHAEKILWRLQQQLRAGSYRHGKYRTFKVYDPKQRDSLNGWSNQRVGLYKSPLD